MNVYRKRPSGLAPHDLARATRVSAWRSALALAALGAAVVCFGFMGSSFGELFVLLGLVLLASTLRFAMFSRELALIRPCVVLSSAPKWDGVVRTAWLVLADDPVASARSLAAALDGELGAALVATIDADGSPTGTTLSQALAQSERPVLIGWAAERGAAPSLDASTDRPGIWLRVDVAAEGAAPSAATASLLASDGAATDALCRIAAKV